MNEKWAIAAAQYADCGPLRHFVAGNDQFHEVRAVLDRSSRILSVETGVGVGVTAGADKLTFKLMLSRESRGSGWANCPWGYGRGSPEYYSCWALTQEELPDGSLSRSRQNETGTSEHYLELVSEGFTHPSAGHNLTTGAGNLESAGPAYSSFDPSS